jgi:uncharacterized membrane protein YciS (DUF1049 family)
MRYFYLVLLIVILAAVIVFVFQNDERVTLRFFEWQVTLRLAVLVAVSYVLGMVSGWSVFGFLRRSIRRVTDHTPSQRPHS